MKNCKVNCRASGTRKKKLSTTAQAPAGNVPWSRQYQLYDIREYIYIYIYTYIYTYIYIYI